MYALEEWWGVCPSPINPLSLCCWSLGFKFTKTWSLFDHEWGHQFFCWRIWSIPTLILYPKRFCIRFLPGAYGRKGTLGFHTMRKRAPRISLVFFLGFSLKTHPFMIGNLWENPPILWRSLLLVFGIDLWT